MKGHERLTLAVTPAQAGVRLRADTHVDGKLNPGLRRDDGKRECAGGRKPGTYRSRLGFTGAALSGSSGQACLGYLPRMSERTDG